MDRNSKKVLKFLKLSGGCDNAFSFDVLDDMSESLDIPVEDLRANIRYLKDCDYITYSRTSSGHILSFSLTHRGLHYKEFAWEAVKLFCIKSVLVPIVVAIITSLVVSWLTIN